MPGDPRRNRLAQRRQSRRTSHRENGNLVFLAAWISGYQRQVFADSLSNQHPVEGVPVDHRQPGGRDRMVMPDGRCRNPQSRINSGRLTGFASLPIACLMATSQIVAALT